MPPERRKIRPNVEATVKGFTKPFNHKGKLRIRGLFKTMVYAHAMAISINFGRLWRYMGENPDLFALLSLLYGILPSRSARHWQNQLRRATIESQNRQLPEPSQYFTKAA